MINKIWLIRQFNKTQIWIFNNIIIFETNNRKKLHHTKETTSGTNVASKFDEDIQKNQIVF